MNTITPKTQKNKKLLLASGCTLAAVILILTAIILYQKLYYGNRWYKNTSINGVTVSGMTLDESKEALLNKCSQYSLDINGRDGGKFTLNASDISLQFTVPNELKKQFQQQHDRFQLFSQKTNISIPFEITYEQSRLKNILNGSELIKGSKTYPIVKPVSATVEYSPEKKQYFCVPEIEGNTLIKANLYEAVKDAMENMDTTIVLSNTEKYPDVYKKPKVSSEDEALVSQLEQSNSAVSRYIVWNMGKGHSEQITPAEIAQWITWKKGKLCYDKEAIQDWVEAFCLKYKTVGKTRTLITHNKKKVKVSGGDYGWQIDYEKTVKQTMNALKASIDSEKTQAYIEAPTTENQNNITLKRKVIYANTAYQKDYVDFENDWDPNNYIEIDLKKQKVYVIKNGKVYYSCKAITGRPVADRETRKGVYFIKEHRTNYTLRGTTPGDTYETFVKYWVRITWTGTGFHPASWQPWSRWTKDLYKTRGSHGCINLEPKAAEKIYKLAKYRMAVFIY